MARGRQRRCCKCRTVLGPFSCSCGRHGMTVLPNRSCRLSETRSLIARPAELHRWTAGWGGVHSMSMQTCKAVSQQSFLSDFPGRAGTSTIEREKHKTSSPTIPTARTDTNSNKQMCLIPGFQHDPHGSKALEPLRVLASEDILIYSHVPPQSPWQLHATSKPGESASVCLDLLT